MLDLFICHLNPSAMRLLAQKLEEAGVDSELRRHCERILRARSVGWTQGIFANFAAESMVPKGSEWGGGNWEIKTPTNLKAISQWELATEVMPYMRTNENAVPAVVVDHIGVYLGVVKGRTRVAEVSEKSIVNVLEIGQAIQPKSKGTSLSDQLVVAQSAASDEQARAAEDFKKSLYCGGGDGGSSDEEEATAKTKKFQIRIREKPVAPTVDLNKIKEATKQLKLGDSMPLPLRTQSLSGSSQAPPPDLFGDSGLPLPPTVPPSEATTLMVGGMGVTAGPIPENFFENTISSVQLNASLQPPTSLTSLPIQNSQNMGEKVNPDVPGFPANQVVDFGLPGGGVPPTAQEQPPPLASFNSTGLLGGSAPSQPSQPPQPLALTPQPVVSSQPVDLSVLMAPGPDKPPPIAPPKAVLPGQASTKELSKS